MMRSGTWGKPSRTLFSLDVSQCHTVMPGGVRVGDEKGKLGLRAGRLEKKKSRTLFCPTKITRVNAIISFIKK